MSKIVRMRCPGKPAAPKLAKIHIAKKQLAMEDDSYRSMLKRVTGKTSAADLSPSQMDDVLKEFARLGFKATTKTPTQKGGLPSEAQARKIRALWLNLYHLGELENSAEEALLAYCNRMGGVERIEWMHAKQFDNVIRGLLGWLARLGWENPSQNTINQISCYRLSMNADPAGSTRNCDGIAAKAATIRAQYKKLGILLEGFVPELVPAEDMDDLIASLGGRIRAAKEPA